MTTPQDRIRELVRKTKRCLMEAEHSYDKQRKELLNILIEIQNTCSHEKSVHYPDASGNNDWHDTCTICGKQAKRLNEPEPFYIT